MTRIAAIIPVGTLAGAKTRLGDSLDAEEREELVQRLLARTVVAALAVDRFADVLVASPDRDVLRRATELGARTLRQRSRGLNAGLREARADVVAGGAEAIVILPIDLPFITTDAVENDLRDADRFVGMIGEDVARGRHDALERLDAAHLLRRAGAAKLVAIGQGGGCASRPTSADALDRRAAHESSRSIDKT